MHCVAAVEKALLTVEGVDSVSVSLEGKNAVVSGTPTREQLASAIEEAGYKVVD